MPTNRYYHNVIAGNQLWNSEVHLIKPNETGSQSQVVDFGRLITDSDAGLQNGRRGSGRRFCSRKPSAAGMHWTTTCQVGHDHIVHMGWSRWAVQLAVLVHDHCVVVA